MLLLTLNTQQFDSNALDHVCHLCSLRTTYGGVFSLKIGSYKFVMASTPEAVKELLVTKSVDFAGRPQTFSSIRRTLGKYK